MPTMTDGAAAGSIIVSEVRQAHAIDGGGDELSELARAALQSVLMVSQKAGALAWNSSAFAGCSA